MDAVCEAIAEALARGEDVRIVGSETFRTRSRPGRMECNPRAGESMKIAVSTAPTFQAWQAAEGCRQRGERVLKEDLSAVHDTR